MLNGIKREKREIVFLRQNKSFYNTNCHLFCRKCDKNFDETTAEGFLNVSIRDGLYVCVKPPSARNNRMDRAMKDAWLNMKCDKCQSKMYRMITIDDEFGRFSGVLTHECIL